MNKIISKSSKYLVLTIVVVIGFFCIRDIYIKNQISNHGKAIIVKFTSKQRIPKTTKFNFTYFINNKKYSTSNSGINYSIFNSEKETQIIDSLKLNCFYLAKYLPQHPEIIIVNPMIEIKDTMQIKNAGFK